MDGTGDGAPPSTPTARAYRSVHKSRDLGASPLPVPAHVRPGRPSMRAAGSHGSLSTTVPSTRGPRPRGLAEFVGLGPVAHD